MEVLRWQSHKKKTEQGEKQGKKSYVEELLQPEENFV